ncbi:hypothetical protein [Aquabacterium sp. CECT 9606]|uniref:hypothetical protein n=1 Tax=Aquabacterium sp. CECT 9606 TaxID=2845822 RepID=UPI001E517C85|nr:hypothetical protein [Aquabacterium sp. CECT 9606]
MGKIVARYAHAVVVNKQGHVAVAGRHGDVDLTIVCHVSNGVGQHIGQQGPHLERAAQDLARLSLRQPDVDVYSDRQWEQISDHFAHDCHHITRLNWRGVNPVLYPGQ